MPQAHLTLKEVKEKYRDPRDKDQKVNWVGKYLYEPMAIPVGSFLLRTPISANQITVIWILVGVLGCLLLAVPLKLSAFFACFCLYLHRVLDYADGIVARARRNISSNGVFLDRIGHDVVYPATFFALALRGTKIYPPILILTLGFLSTMSFFLYNNNRRSKILSYFFWQKQLKYHKLLELVKGIGDPKPNPGESQFPPLYFLKQIFQRIQWIWSPEYYLLILYAITLIDRLEWIPIFYAVTTVPLFIIGVYHQSRCGDRWVEEFIIEPQTATDWH